MPKRSARGNYYAEGIVDRDGGHYIREVARQARTFADARRALDKAGLRGYVQQWSDTTQRRTVVAERDTDGSWFSLDPHTGQRVAMPARQIA
jgi:hypothetical protein